MKKIMLPFATIVLFSLATFAQTSTTNQSSTQGTQSASPTMQQPSTQAGSTGMNGNATDTSEKKIKGCVAQQNGQYVLQTKHGKSVPLSGEDVSAHVGHMVTLHGMWSGGAGAQVSTGSTGAAGSFQVTKVDMISDSCTIGNGKSTGSNGNTPQQ